MPFITRLKVARGPRVTIVLGSAEVVFDKVTLANGRSVMLAEVGDDGRGAAACRQARKLPRHYRVSGNPPRLLSSKATPVAAPPRAVKLAVPVAVARGNGWSARDLLGAGEGEQWGELGGRSDRTGLTMSEMALCKPPEGWAARGDGEAWPWDIPGWRGPAADWRPPGVPRRLPLDLDDTDTDTDTDPADDGAADDGAAEPTIDLQPVVDDDQQRIDDETLSTYRDDPAEQSTAVDIVRGLITKSGGSLPSRSKAGYWLRKDGGLPYPNDDQLAALVRRALNPTA